MCAPPETKRSSDNGKVYNIYYLVELFMMSINTKVKIHSSIYIEVTEVCTHACEVRNLL